MSLRRGAVGSLAAAQQGPGCLPVPVPTAQLSQETWSHDESVDGITGRVQNGGDRQRQDSDREEGRDTQRN